jgi:3-deoxy-D-manno-octulosonic-acid transferase
LLFNRKVRRGLRGASQHARLRVYVRNNPDRRRLWNTRLQHGEFEQAKPIIEALRAICRIWRWWPPSSRLGYETIFATPSSTPQSNPFDTARAARAFLELLRPTAAVFIRYDVWPNHLWACRDLGIPAMLANATLRADSPRLLPVLRAFHRNIFECMTSILTVGEEDAANFRRFGLCGPHIAAVGDTRFDRVSTKAEQSARAPRSPAHIREVAACWSSQQLVRGREVFPSFRTKVARSRSRCARHHRAA